MTQYRLAAKPSKMWFSWIWTVCALLAVFIALLVGLFSWPPLGALAFRLNPNLPLFLILSLAAGIVIFVGTLLAIPGLLKNRLAYLLEITPEGVLLHWPPMRDQFLRRDEILGWADFRDQGVRLLPANPFRQIFVPNDLEDYSGFRAELGAMGISEIDPRNKWRIYLKMSAPPLFLMLSLTGVFLLQNPVQVAAAGIITLACTYWLQRMSRQMYKNGPLIGPWVLGIRGGSFGLAESIAAGVRCVLDDE